MPKLEYFIVCESISVDRDTNRVSLFNVVEDLSAVPQGQPAIVVAQLVAVSAWNREPEDSGQDFQAILRIHPPGDEPRDFAVNFRMRQARHRLYMRVQGVPAQRPGELKFELLLNSRHAATHTITIHPAEQFPPSPAEAS